jgi:hypothetical protein
MNSDTEWFLSNQIQIMRALAMLLAGTVSSLAAAQLNDIANLTDKYIAERKRFKDEFQAEMSRA